MKRRQLIVGFLSGLGLSTFVFGQARGQRARPEKARDPVCGLMVEKDPNLSTDYNGRTYYFCSIADREKFKKNPQKYVKEK
jgi:YHS domain-containing protein